MLYHVSLTAKGSLESHIVVNAESVIEAEEKAIASANFEHVSWQERVDFESIDALATPMAIPEIEEVAGVY